jgi:hypothetical protein
MKKPGLYLALFFLVALPIHAWADQYAPPGIPIVPSDDNSAPLLTNDNASTPVLPPPASDDNFNATPIDDGPTVMGQPKQGIIYGRYPNDQKPYQKETVPGYNNIDTSTPVPQR